MIRIQACYFLALLIGSVLLFHSTTASTFIQRSSKGNRGSHYASDDQGYSSGSQNVLVQSNRQGGGKNKGLLHKDNIIQQDNIIQKDKLAKKCNGEKAKCSAIESIVESHVKALEKNVATFQKLNKDIEELLKTVSNPENSCNEDNQTNGNETEDATPNSLKPKMGPAAATVIGSVAPDLLNMFNDWTQTINEVSEDRDEFIKRTIDHWQAAKPDYNVMVLNNKWKHDVTIDDGVHAHVEIPRKPSGTHGFDVYVFKSGTITRHGDGGWINWGFAGKYEKIGDATVKFSA